MHFRWSFIFSTYGLYFLPGSNVAPFEEVKVPVSNSANCFPKKFHLKDFDKFGVVRVKELDISFQSLQGNLFSVDITFKTLQLPPNPPKSFFWFCLILMGSVLQQIEEHIAGMWLDKSKKSWKMGSWPGSPFGLEDKAPWTSWMFNLEDYRLPIYSSSFPLWLLLFFQEFVNLKKKNPEIRK